MNGACVLLRASAMSSAAGPLSIAEEEALMANNDGLRVQGIEVNQAIQYYRSEMHLSDPLDRAPDDSLRLVAEKAAWARVYVGSGVATSNVTGTLRVERAFPYSFLAELTPQPPGMVTAIPEPSTATPFITPQTFYRMERSNPATTLNCVIRLPQWISPYGHKLRINNPLLNPTAVCDPRLDYLYPPKIPIDVTFPFVPAKPRPMISLIGIQDLMGKVTIVDVFRTVRVPQ
jgi:hypothetical protein